MGTSGKPSAENTWLWTWANMCGANANAGLEASIDHAPSAGDAAHAGEVDADDVDGVGAQQGLRVVAATLLVAHRDRHRHPLAQLANETGVTRRKHVLEPTQSDVVDRLDELDGGVDVVVDPRRVAADPGVGSVAPARPAGDRRRARRVAATGALKRRQPASYSSAVCLPVSSGPIGPGG